MKGIPALLIISLLVSCGQSGSRKDPTKEALVTKGLSDSVKLVASLKEFDAKYKKLEKSLSDSVFKYKPEDNDFSDLTGGIERNYMECNNELEKILLGYKLAANYMIHYDGSKEAKYKQKAEPLFYSFISFKDGEVASQYMKLDLKLVQFAQKEWGNFSEQDKETMLFYGLLRGFDNGLPGVLKNVK